MSGVQEKTLFRVAITVAIAGILILFFLAELPPTSITGTLVWHENERGLLLTTQSYWITFTEQPPVVGTCITVAGVVRDEQITNAHVLQVHPPNSRNCP